MTNKQAKAIIEQNKENTAYYNGYISVLTNQLVSFSYDEMYDTFRGKGFGKAETLCIISALQLSGAKFKGELTLDY